MKNSEPQIAVSFKWTIDGNILTMRAPMVAAVDRCARTDFKVIGVIIGGIAVNVVNNLALP